MPKNNIRSIHPAEILMEKLLQPSKLPINANRERKGSPSVPYDSSLPRLTP